MNPLTAFLARSKSIQCFDFDIANTGSSSNVGEASRIPSEILKNIEADLLAGFRR